MSTNHNTKNLFEAFSFRGGCFHERMSGVVRSVPFLTGMALAAVLGLMFALSTSAFAFGGGGGGGSAPVSKITKLNNPVTKPVDEVAGVKAPVVDPKDSPAIEPDEETAGLPKSDGKPAKTNDKTGTLGDEVAGAGEPEEKIPEVDGLTANEPEEDAPATKDPADKLDSKSEETEDEAAETGVPGDETARAGGPADEPGDESLGDKTATKPDDDGNDDNFAEGDIVAATVGFATSYSEAREGDDVELQVVLSKPLPRTITLRLVPQYGTASVDGDIVSLPGAVTFSPGATMASVNFTIVDDSVVESHETITFALRKGDEPRALSGSDSKYVRTISPGRHTVTIFDNDGTENGQTVEVDKGPVVIHKREYAPRARTTKVLLPVARPNVDDAIIRFATLVSEAEEGDALKLQVQLSKPLSQPVTLTLMEAKHGGGPADIINPSGGFPLRVTFSPGETRKVLNLMVVDDEQSEGTEMVMYDLAGGGRLPDGVRFGMPRIHFVTIIDDDDAGMNQIPEDETQEIKDSVDKPDAKSGDEVVSADNGITTTVTTEYKERCDGIFELAEYLCLSEGDIVATSVVASMVIDGEHVGDLRTEQYTYGIGSRVAYTLSDGSITVTRLPAVLDDTTVVTTSGVASGGDTGVHVPWGIGDHIDLINNADIDDMDYGIKSVHDGMGELDIVNNGRILNVKKNAIYATHTGERDLRIRAENNRDDGLVSEIVSLADGIFAQHDGEGHVLVHVASGARIVSKEGSGVYVEHEGKGDVDVFIQGEVRGDETGVSVVRGDKTKRYVEIVVGPEAEVYGGSSGIQTSTNEAHLTIDVSGKVLGAEGVAIDIGSRGDFVHNILILRPGYDLDGTVVGRGDIKLSRPRFPGTFEVPVFDLSLEKFGDFDFNAFSTEGYWVLTGKMDEDRAFARVNARGVLRFSDADFRMKHERNRFLSPDMLEIAGSNYLRGNFANRGDIVFVQEGNDASLTDASLEITGNYRPGEREYSDVVFNVDFARGKANELVIFGDVEERNAKKRDSQHVSMRVLDELKLGGESPVLITAHKYAQADDFEGEETIGAFNYVLEHEAVGAVLPVPSDELDGYIDNMRREVEDYYDNLYDDIVDRYDVFNLTEEEYKVYREELDAYYEAYYEALDNVSAKGSFGYHTWRFVKDKLSDTAVKTSQIADEVSDSIETPPANNPDKKTELGLWGEQSGSRTTIGLNALATRLMGGDMVVGTSVSRNFSTSNNVNVEGQITALVANWERKGFYVGGQTRYARFTSDVSTDRLSVVRNNDGTGINASVDLGYRFAFPFSRVDFEVSPQMQLTWSRVNFDDFIGPHGELVSLEDGDLVTGRLGLLWNGEWQGAGGFGQVYGSMRLRGAVDGRTAVNISGVSIASERKGLSVDGRLGLSYEWDEGYAVHGEVSALRDEDVDEIRADLGVRIDF